MDEEEERFHRLLLAAATSWVGRQATNDSTQLIRKGENGGWCLLFESLDEVAAVTVGTKAPAKAAFLPVSVVSELTDGDVPTLRYNVATEVVVVAIVALPAAAVGAESAAITTTSTRASDADDGSERRHGAANFHSYFVVDVAAAADALASASSPRGETIVAPSVARRVPGLRQAGKRSRGAGDDDGRSGPYVAGE